MNHHDDAIDAVLKSLGSAEPSAGFEARLHHALQQAPPPRHAWNIRWMLIAAACCMVCAVAVFIGMQPNYRRNPIAITRPLETPSHNAAPVIMQEIPVQQREVRRRPAKLARVAAASSSDPDVAMTHRNMPPPPLPLTQEERLVLRMMRHNDLPQLAALSSEARARSLHDDAEEYRNYFAPRPPLEGQPYYDQHIISGGSQ